VLPPQTREVIARFFIAAPEQTKLLPCASQHNDTLTTTPSAPLAKGFRRFGAFIHEAFFLVALIFIAQFLVTRLAGGEYKGMWRNIAQGFLVLVMGAYFIWQWTGGRRTLAQKTWSLALRTQSGALLTISHALKRYAAAWIGPALALGAGTAIGKAGLLFLLFNFVWIFFDREGQTLHDRLAGTRLIVQDATTQS
jgi:uncharacterized RDD family membrane protein YckC